MQEFPRHTINRAVIVLLPKQPALDWIKRIDPSPPNLTLDELRQESDAFLVRDERMEFPEDAERWVHRRWKMFFEMFIADWYIDESLWPQKRTLKMFKDWFEIQYHPMVWDLSDGPIVNEDWD